MINYIINSLTKYKQYLIILQYIAYQCAISNKVFTPIVMYYLVILPSVASSTYFGHRRVERAVMGGGPCAYKRLKGHVLYQQSINITNMGQVAVSSTAVSCCSSEAPRPTIVRFCKQEEPLYYNFQGTLCGTKHNLSMMKDSCSYRASACKIYNFFIVVYKCQ